MADWESDPVVGGGSDWQNDPVAYYPQGLSPAQEVGFEQQFSQEHPYIYGVGKAITGIVPKSLDELRQMAQLPMPSQQADEQLAESERLGQAWRGEFGPVEQSAGITGSVLQALPLFHLPFAESPLRATPSDLAMVNEMRQAQSDPVILPADVVQSEIAPQREIRTSPETGFQFYADTGEPVLPQEQQGARLSTPDELTRQVAEAPEAAAPGDIAPRQQPTIPPEDARYAGLGQPESAMGGERTGQEADVSTKNEYTDAAREEAALPARIEQAAAEDFGQQTWDASAERLSSDPGAGQRLVEAINSGKVRAIDADDNALLLREQIKARTEHSQAVDAKNAADASGDQNTIDAAAARLEQARQNYQNVLDADVKAGTSLSHGFSARKMMANEDYSLARMEATVKAAQNGKRIGDAQQAYIEDLQKRIENLENQASQYNVGNARPRSERMRIKSDARDAAAKGQAINDFLSEKANAARARIKQMMEEGVNCV